MPLHLIAGMSQIRSMGKKHKPETKVRVRSLYIHGLSAAIVAKECGVSDATVGNWKKKALQAGDDWDEMRAVYLLVADGAESMGAQILRDFSCEINLVMQELKRLRETNKIVPAESTRIMASAADAYTKIRKAVKDTSPKLNKFTIAEEVMRHFGAYVKEEWPEHFVVYNNNILPSFASVLPRKLSEK